MMSTDKLRQQFKGQLYKYTNVVKGWQYRWFILDPETGILDYYVTDSQRKQRPRGSVHLAAAVISPSDEDSSTFTVNSASGEVFKLQAADARERQEWVNRLRAVAEMHTMAIAQSNPPLPPREHHSVLPLPHPTAVPAAQGPRVHCTLAVLDSFQSARQNLQKAELRNIALAQVIDNLPSSGPGISNVDPDLLLLKATSQATIACLGQCLSILQQQQIGPSPRTNQPQQPPVPKKPTPTHYLPPQAIDLAERKSVSNSEIVSAGTGPSSYRPLKLPREAETINAEDEVTDNEEDLQEICVYEEHNTLLRLASHTKRGTDLTRVVLPTFLLEPRSLLEMLSEFWGHTNLFTDISTYSTAQERMIAVLKWYLTSFHLGLNIQRGKKPYNPLLGEIFHCSWKVPNQNKSDAAVRFVAEQVSHHPPVSAIYVECAPRQICLVGHISPRSIFTGMSVDVSFTGGLSLMLGNYGERYEISLPTTHARSIITKPWVQLGGKVTISCVSTGLTATVSHPKSFFGDKPHQVIGEVKDTNSSIVCKFQGDWKTHFKFTFPDSSNAILDVSDLRVFPRRVRKLNNQSAFESRKLWLHVNAALRKGNVSLASNKRLQLEEEQRLRLSKYESSGGVEPTYFVSKPDDSGGWNYRRPLLDV